MGSLVQLFNEWEIQLLVLLSFMLQVFLFFVGGFRRRATNKFLRCLIWMAYLGADLVAVYTLGLLSRQEDKLTGNHQLAFFWAPFLLIHLGGQDTITAFAIEDINLWLRHLLNLVVQVTLALYILWKSTSGPNVHQLVVPSILLFLTGTIKYGERTWALWRGSPKSIADSAARPRHVDQWHQALGREPSSEAVSLALYSIEEVSIKFYYRDNWRTYYDWLDQEAPPVQLLTPKLLGIFEIQLAIMFDQIYTKAVVLRTRGGIILRCASQLSFLAAFVLFCMRNKDIRYNLVDTTVTYALFIGGFCLEVCAVFVTMMSPWTWAWLKARHCSFLASINIGWQRRRVLWSNSMGQYNLLNYFGQYDQETITPWRRQVMAIIRKVVSVACGSEQKLWISKMLDTKFVEVDTEIMSSMEKVVSLMKHRGEGCGIREKWPNLGKLLYELLKYSHGEMTFDCIIYVLHIYTEVYLSRYSSTGVDCESTGVLVRVCKHLSNYMVYVASTHLEMLQVNIKIGGNLISFLDQITSLVNQGICDGSRDSILRQLATRMDSILGQSLIGLNHSWSTNFYDIGLLICDWPLDCQVLEEIRDAWIGLLFYAAGNSRPEMHAAQLARGGELLTFVWLLTCHFMDDFRRFELTNVSRGDGDSKFCIFHLPPASGGAEDQEHGVSAEYQLSDQEHGGAAVHVSESELSDQELSHPRQAA